MSNIYDYLVVHETKKSARTAKKLNLQFSDTPGKCNHISKGDIISSQCREIILHNIHLDKMTLDWLNECVLTKLIRN